jgi:hypothetical protein
MAWRSPTPPTRSRLAAAISTNRTVLSAAPVAGRLLLVMEESGAIIASLGLAVGCSIMPIAGSGVEVGCSIIPMAGSGVAVAACARLGAFDVPPRGRAWTEGLRARANKLSIVSTRSVVEASLNLFMGFLL